MFDIPPMVKARDTAATAAAIPPTKWPVNRLTVRTLVHMHIYAIHTYNAHLLQKSTGQWEILVGNWVHYHYP